MHSYSYGETPKEIILKQAYAECPDGFTMTIRSQHEWSVLATVVNIGIDSHLEAIVKSTFDANTGECVVHPDDMPVLLRRLWEDGSELAWDLRSSIIQCLNIEEV